MSRRRVGLGFHQTPESLRRMNWTRGTWVLVLLFALTEAAANWLAVQFKLAVGPFLIPGGSLLIPISLLLRDQLHLRHPHSALWAALGVGAFVSVGYSFEIARVALASVLAFVMSFAIDSWVFGKLASRSLPTRMRWSNWASLPVDTLVFVPIAFAGLFPIGALIPGQIIAKLLMTEVAILVFWGYQRLRIRRQLAQMRRDWGP